MTPHGPAQDVMVYDDTPCALGEGALWHPARQQLFWFDILRQRLHTRDGEGHRRWDFEQMVSAAGWVDARRLLIAAETRLFVFDVENGRREDLCPLEAENPLTRSNDGRADPWGGFWISTMGKKHEHGAGTIYRYFRGELTPIAAPLSIPNGICFSPDRRFAYFTDTPTSIIRRQRLSPDDGFPDGPAEDWADLRAERLKPDGAVTDADGNLWTALHGAARVACYGPDGRFRRAIDFPARNLTCPAFGGPNLSTLYCTSARDGLRSGEIDRVPENGMLLAAEGGAAGRAEPQVIL